MPFMRKREKRNTINTERPQMTMWHMHNACWNPKATDTHPQYVTLMVLPLQQWL